MKSIFHRLLRSDPTTDTNDNNDGDEGGGDGIGRRLQARDLWWLQNKDENRSRNEDKISEGDNNDGTANVDASIGANNVSSNNNNRSMMSRMFADVSPDNEDNTHNNLPGYADNESCRSEDYSDMIDVLSSVDTNTHSPQRRHDGHSDHAHTDRGSGSGTHRDKQLSLHAFTQTLSDIQHDLPHPAPPTTNPTTTANTHRGRNGDDDEEQEELYEQTLSPPSSTGSVSSPSPQKFILRPTQQTHTHIQPAHTQTPTDADTPTPTPTPTPPRAHTHRSSPSKIPLPALAAALFADDEPVSAHTSGRPTHTRARMYSSPSARPSRIPRHLSAHTPTTPTTSTHKQTPKQTRTPTDTHNISPSKRHAHLVAPSPPRETIVPRNAYAHTQNDYVYYVTATLDYEQTHPHMKANPYAYTHNHDNSYVLDPDEQLSTHSSTRSPSQRASTHRHTHSPTHSLTHSPTQRTHSRQQTHHDTNNNYNDDDDAQAISTTASTRDIVTAAVSKHSYANKQTEHAALLQSLGVSTQPPYVSVSAHTQPAHIQHAYVHLDNNDDSDTIAMSSKFSKLDRQLSIYKKKFADLAASKQSKQQSPVRKHTSTHHRDRTIDDIFNSGLHTNTNSSNKHSPMSALSAFKYTNTHTASPPPPPPPAHSPPQTHRSVHTNTHTHDDDDGDDMSDMTASRVHSHAHTDIDPADSVTDDVLTRKMLALLRKANKLTQSYDAPAVDTADTRGSGDTHTGNTRSADTHTNTGTHTDRRIGATGHRQTQVDNDVGNDEVDGDEDDDVLARARRLIAAVNGNTQHAQHTQQQAHTHPTDTDTRTDDHSMNALRVSQGTEDVINVLNTPPSRTRSPTESPTESPSVHGRTTQAQDASQSPPKEASNPSNTRSNTTGSSATPGDVNDDDADDDEYDFSDSSYFIKPSSKPQQQQPASVDNTNANVNANMSTSSLTSLFPSLESTHKTASAPSSSRVRDGDEDDDAYIASTEASAGARAAAGPSKQGQYQQYMQQQQRQQRTGSAASSDAKYDSEEDEKAVDISRPRADSPILPGHTRFGDANDEEDDDDDDNDSLRRAHTLLSKYSQRYSQSQSHEPRRRDESSPVKDSSVLYLSSSGELESKYTKPVVQPSSTPVAATTAAFVDVDTQTQASTPSVNTEESPVSEHSSGAAERSVSSSRPVVNIDELYLSLPVLATDKSIAITTAVTYTPRITPDRDCVQSIIFRLANNGSGAAANVDNVMKDPTLYGLLQRLEDVRAKMTDLSKTPYQQSVRE
jgi:hypothetical protein